MIFVIPFALLVPLVWQRRSPEAALKLFIVLSFVYHAVFEAVMFVLFAATGRLTALTFSLVLPRYGAGWDDPNGFAAMAILFMAVLWALPKGEGLSTNQRRISVVIITFLTLFTYSVTGILGLAALTLIALVLRLAPLIDAALVALATAVFMAAHYLFGYWDLLVQAKFASSAGHFADIANVPNDLADINSWLRNLEFLSPLLGSFRHISFHENLYLQIFNNYGLVGLGLLVGIIMATIYQAYRSLTTAGDKTDRIIFRTTLIFLPIFALLNFGIPLFQVFPINLFVWVLIGLVWARSQIVSWPKLHLIFK